ncbi:DNA-3-methyladenine glycosylase family protein [Maribellus maritimus]|uniref:DNA-3-methyladenine glycosylase family protein n=1 Tax=Maribellus maritimus TaxID=2870838 RepID=UPI001EEA8CEA|nr:hypothetical protein [Maribellus maritimus]MCG6187868.1 hypothetical protein [Maribellus maritimus]
MDRIKNLKAFYKHCDLCIQIEPKLKPVIAKYGYPPMWHRQPNFATLILTILEQQVSLASAKAAFIKLENPIGEVTPKNILQLSDEDLRACYFSRQKTKYARILATEIIEGKLDLDSLNQMDEPEIRSRLITIKGIGHWTIDMYVLMSLLFADIFPPGDLATVKSVFETELVAPESSKEDIIKYMEKFSPYRSAATYILWHSYIKKRNLILE